MKVFVDAMGGDYAPQAVIAGVALARKDKAITAEIVLLGDKNLLEPHLARFKGKRPEVIHCSEVVGMGESPVTVVRAKKDSSIVRGLQLTESTPNSAFFSAGHSGACFAAALMTLGRIPGVERPAIAAIMPSPKGAFILLDAGANVDCRPNHLADFGRMGSTFAKQYLNVERPAVGILSNGEEESKGTDLTRAAHDILKNDSSVNYIGYIEGKLIFRGGVHVVVADGFTGNVVLKSLEGLGRAFSGLLQDEIKGGFFSKIGAVFMYSALKALRKRLDYAEVGSAPLLGVDGNCFIGHGSSNARAIKNGILRAQEAIEMNLHANLREQFKAAKKAVV
ncbi:MAG: phosphate acyltransferase PlsX [Deltaproteobacteria bacterium]|nr:phosphate acyltransferase PlsX [Deltaproteobacteria bacterium]